MADVPRSPAPDGPKANPDPDGYCRYYCPRCGAWFQTTRRIGGAYGRCHGDCGPELRWFLPRHDRLILDAVLNSLPRR